MRSQWDIDNLIEMKEKEKWQEFEKRKGRFYSLIRGHALNLIWYNGIGVIRDGDTMYFYESFDPSTPVFHHYLENTHIANVGNLFHLLATVEMRGEGTIKVWGGYGDEKYITLPSHMEIGIRPKNPKDMYLEMFNSGMSNQMLSLYVNERQVMKNFIDTDLEGAVICEMMFKLLLPQVKIEHEYYFMDDKIQRNIPNPYVSKEVEESIDSFFQNGVEKIS